jgi:hypothetical protein
MEISGIDKALTNRVWVREHFLYDIPSLEDRIYFAGILQEMIQIIVDSECSIIQIVYETVQERFQQLRQLGFVSVMSEKSGQTFQILEYDTCSFQKTNSTDDSNEPAYENISTDIEHIKKYFEFHTKKVTVNQLNNCVDHLVSINDSVLFLGFTESSPMFRTFVQHNYLMKLDYHFVNNIVDIQQIQDVEQDKFILVVNNTMDIAKAIEVIKEFKAQIKVVVCDTDDDYFDSLMLLSTCKRHRILHVKRMQHSCFFNFGVLKRYELCSSNMDECNNGVVSLNDNVWVSERSYTVFLDPRYADITRVISAMELCNDVWSITVLDDVVKNTMGTLYEYKFMPHFHTEQIMHISKLVKGGNMHTPICFFTTFPAVARILFESSVFVSCEKEHLLQYQKQVSDTFKKAIDDHFKNHLSRINDAKSLAFQMSRKMDFVRQAQQRQRKRIVMETLTKKFDQIKVK